MSSSENGYDFWVQTKNCSAQHWIPQVAEIWLTYSTIFFTLIQDMFQSILGGFGERTHT